MATIGMNKLLRKKARHDDAGQWTVVPGTQRELDAVVHHCRRMVSRRALMAAGVSVVPIPGIDWLTDIAVLMKLIPDINQAFGLTAGQVERLAPDRRVVVYKAISAGGSMLVGRLVTREVVIQTLKLVGIRLSTQKAAKFVPIAGQALSAALTYSSLRYVCEQHIQQCVAVSRQLLLAAPTQASDAD
ncbi:MAG: hypothetical protein ABI699_11710 [Caldimonas sp.]